MERSSIIAKTEYHNEYLTWKGWNGLDTREESFELTSLAMLRNPITTIVQPLKVHLYNVMTELQLS
jgi:hypothetical protein